MSTNAAAKRSRATNEQLNQMVDFMLGNPGLAGGKFQKLHGKVESDCKWNELAGILNCLGGAVKTVDQWRIVWRDIKSRTSIKVRDRKKQQAMTGNKPLSVDPISELERRVISIIGSEYIEGQSSVRENVAMEEEHQLLLEDGEEDFRLEMPSSSSISDVQCATPSIAKATPRRGVKRRRVEAEAEKQDKFLEIAGKQADALKMLAECSAGNLEATKMMAESNKMMAEALKTMEEGLKASADAFNNLANALNRLQ